MRLRWLARKKDRMVKKKNSIFLYFYRMLKTKKNPKFLGGCDGTEKKGEHQGTR